MSEIDKQKKVTEDLINDSFDDDDLWALQSSEEGALPPTEDRQDFASNDSEKAEIITAEIIENEKDNYPEKNDHESNTKEIINPEEIELVREKIAQQQMIIPDLKMIDKVAEKQPILKLEEDYVVQEEINTVPEDQPLQEVKTIALDDDIVADKMNLKEEKEQLIKDIQGLLSQKNDLLKQQLEIQENLNLLVREGLKELENKKQNLEIAIQKLERRQERITKEMKTTFSGVSQDLAIRVQGFKDYLVGSLQDLALAAEQLELETGKNESWQQPITTTNQNSSAETAPSFVDKGFQEETKIIRSLLDQYRTSPDYYGPPWQLRRTFEPIHAERVGNWFFSQGGKGTIKGMTSRLQNILVASAIIAILSYLYGDRARILILADTPEKLGEWRRGLQDCLGISRSDFGPNRGVVLFETPEALCQKADRLMEEKDLPLVIMDQNDDKVSLSLLQFPLWLAFAPEKPTSGYDYF